MLEVKDLKKYYKTKGGAEVHALDGVTIQFPETGMVFLLGKSGSGKSTLLNVAGGLDRPDSGEIIVKGKSSKDFTQSDFDSYRNTFVGFVFQEYNILNEFNVETNIALALELQGKKSDTATVNELLKTVDLEGLGKRHPNTLSGGQKQRIAIARALIKSPEIIMADEPTGALDSNTGKQVLDTLKKLSETKLVIIVSHDREFAEHYADRIIELKDGKVLTDNTKTYVSPASENENIQEISENTIRIKDISKLSDEEAGKILKKIKTDGELIISGDEDKLAAFKKAAKISDDGSSEKFIDTDVNNVNITSYDGTKTKFIKSRLPIKHALRMGASNLKIKPGRLILTMLLSITAFLFFGISSTMMFYNPAYSYASAIKDEPYASLVLGKKYDVKNVEYRIDKDGNESPEYTYIEERDTNISKDDIVELNKNSVGLNYAGYYSGEFRFNDNFLIQSSLPYYYNYKLFGLCDCGESYMIENNFEKMAGHYPQNENEIAVSSFTYEMFVKSGYKDPVTNQSKEIRLPSDLVGCKISTTLRSSYLTKNVDFTISGVYRVDEFYSDSQFDVLREDDSSSVSEREYARISRKFEELLDSSFNGLGFVSLNFYDVYKDFLVKEAENYKTYISSTSLFGLKELTEENYKIMQNSSDPDTFYPSSEWENLPAMLLKGAENYKDSLLFVDKNGVAKEQVPSLSMTQGYLNFGHYTVANDLMKMAFHYDEVSEVNYLEDKPEVLGALTRYLASLEDGFYIASLASVYESINFNEFWTHKFDAQDMGILVNAEKAFRNEIGITETNLESFHVLSADKGIYDLNVEGYAMVKSGYSSDFFCLLNNGWEDRSVKPNDFFIEEYTWVTRHETKYQEDTNAQYSKVITPTDRSKAQLDFMLKQYDDDSFYLIDNSVFNQVYFIASLITELQTIFLFAGTVLAVFSGLMLFNFISTSISYKKKEIGILRAVGARGSDVFKIFFSESGIICGICFLVSSLMCSMSCAVLNNQLVEGFNIQIFDFGIINVAIILGVSFIVGFIGTFFPVFKASRKPPVESIRAL
ncbi:MAG: ABC transporter ATP-binding protein/permease [Bacilli bacterium]|nr:ABC transporter ATP-binding protein/permease [Bacilli bacterium]